MSTTNFSYCSCEYQGGGTYAYLFPWMLESAFVTILKCSGESIICCEGDVQCTFDSSNVCLNTATGNGVISASSVGLAMSDCVFYLNTGVDFHLGTPGSPHQLVNCVLSGPQPPPESASADDECLYNTLGALAVDGQAGLRQCAHTVYVIRLGEGGPPDQPTTASPPWSAMFVMSLLPPSTQTRFASSAWIRASLFNQMTADRLETGQFPFSRRASHRPSPTPSKDQSSSILATSQFTAGALVPRGYRLFRSALFVFPLMH
jgi:hypothetical protein